MLTVTDFCLEADYTQISKILTFIKDSRSYPIFMDQAVVNFFQLLVHAGAIPGQDFSCDAEQQAYRLNERCHRLLQTAYPDISWADVLGDPQAGNKDRIHKLHQQLGCCFIDELIPLVQQRFATLPESQAAGYLQALLAGVESATNIVLHPLLQSALSLAEQTRLEWLLRQEVTTVPINLCLQDLLQTAGTIGVDYEVHADEIWLTEAGRQKLALIWHGDYEIYTVEHS